MEENEGRKLFINEFMIDDLERSDFYSPETINKKLDRYFELKLKKEKGDVLKQHLDDRIEYYEQELKNKEQLFKEGKDWTTLTKSLQKVNKNIPSALKNFGIQGMSDISGMSGMQGIPGMNGMSGVPGMDMYGMNNSGMMQPGMAPMLGGNMGWMDPYTGMGMGMNMGLGYDSYGSSMGMGTTGMAGMQQKMKVKAAGSDYEKYITNINEITVLKGKILTKNEEKEREVSDEEKAKKDQTINKHEIDIEKLKNENKKLLEKIKKILPENTIIKQLKKDKKKLKYTIEDEIEYEKLQIFFENILGYDTRPLDECTTNIFQCFNEVYKKAKAFIERESNKYNIIITKYIELLERAPYDYSDQKFIKYMKYITGKILRAKNIYIDNIIPPEDYDINKIIMDDTKLIPENFKFSDFKDKIDKIPSSKFIMFTPEQIQGMSDSQLKELTIDQFSNLSPEAINGLGNRISTVVGNLMQNNNCKNNPQSEECKKLLNQLSNMPAIFPFLKPDQVKPIYNTNPDIVGPNISPSILENNIQLDYTSFPDTDDGLTKLIAFLRKTKKILKLEDIYYLLSRKETNVELFRIIKYDYQNILEEIDFEFKYNTKYLNKESIRLFINESVKYNIIFLPGQQISHPINNKIKINIIYLNKLNDEQIQTIEFKSKTDMTPPFDVVTPVSNMLGGKKKIMRGGPSDTLSHTAEGVPLSPAKDTTLGVPIGVPIGVPVRFPEDVSTDNNNSTYNDQSSSPETDAIKFQEESESAIIKEQTTSDPKFSIDLDAKLDIDGKDKKYVTDILNNFNIRINLLQVEQLVKVCKIIFQSNILFNILKKENLNGIIHHKNNCFLKEIQKFIELLIELNKIELLDDVSIQSIIENIIKNGKNDIKLIEPFIKHLKKEQLNKYLALIGNDPKFLEYLELILKILDYNKRFWIDIKLKSDDFDDIDENIYRKDDKQKIYFIKIKNLLKNYILDIEIKKWTEILNFQYFKNPINYEILNEKTFWKFLRVIYESENNTKVKFYIKFMESLIFKKYNIKNDKIEDIKFNNTFLNNVMIYLFINNIIKDTKFIYYIYNDDIMYDDDTIKNNVENLIKTFIYYYLYYKGDIKYYESFVNSLKILKNDRKFKNFNNLYKKIIENMQQIHDKIDYNDMDEINKQRFKDNDALFLKYIEIIKNLIINPSEYKLETSEPQPQPTTPTIPVTTPIAPVQSISIDIFNQIFNRYKTMPLNFVILNHDGNDYNVKNFLNDKGFLKFLSKRAPNFYENLLNDSDKYFYNIYNKIYIKLYNNNQENLKHINKIFDLKFKLIITDIINKMEELLEQDKIKLNNIEGYITVIQKSNRYGSQSGGADEIKSDNNILINNDAKYDNYMDLIDKWIDTYDEYNSQINELKDKFIDEYNKNYHTKIDYIKNNYKEETSQFDKVLKSKLSSRDSKSEILDNCDELFKYLQRELSTIKNYKLPNIKLENYDKLVDSIKELTDTILKKFKEDKDLKKFLAAKDLEKLSSIIKKNLVDKINKFKKQYDEYYLNIDKSVYETVITYIKNIINYQDKLARTSSSSGLGYSESEFNSILKKIQNEILAFIDYVKNINYDKDKKIEIDAVDLNWGIKDFLEKIKKKIKNRNTTALNRVASTNDDGNGNLITESLYSKLWNKYIENINDEDKLLEESQDKLYTAYQSNNLDPNKALAITTDDKVIFIISILIIRQIALAITESLIDNGVITNIIQALSSYIIIYSFIIIIITIIINFDDYKLRIIFNYYNMHINSTGIFGHIFMVIGLILILYYLSQTIDPLMSNSKTVITEVEKLRLIYKLELMTIAVFVFVATADFFK